MKPRILSSSSFAQMMKTSAIGLLLIHDLMPVSAVPAVHLLRARRHAARIGAVSRLGQSEAADELAGRELRQELLLLRLGAEFVDRHHHQRALHAHHRAEARIDALDLARDQAVADVVHRRAAVLLGNDDAEQVERAHLAEDRRVGLFVPEHLEHARRQPVLRVGARGVAHHLFFVRELLVEEQRVAPVELRAGRLLHIGSKSYRVLRRYAATAQAAASVAGISRIDEDGSSSVDRPILAVTSPLVIAAAHAAAGGTCPRNAAASGMITKNALPSARSGRLHVDQHQHRQRGADRQLADRGAGMTISERRKQPREPERRKDHQGLARRSTDCSSTRSPATSRSKNSTRRFSRCPSRRRYPCTSESPAA